MPFQGYL
jgi:hypothetical protein